jgi:Zn finger protein HypA/HybF involved in hydrogenase expression
VQTIELNSAYHWICPKCNNDNFILPQKMELTPVEKDRLYKTLNKFGNSACLTNKEFVVIPEVVICEHCNAEFYTENNNIV